jgi:hypothetical protein
MDREILDYASPRRTSRHDVGGSTVLVVIIRILASLSGMCAALNIAVLLSPRLAESTNPVFAISYDVVFAAASLGALIGLFIYGLSPTQPMRRWAPALFALTLLFNAFLVVMFGSFQ